MTGTMRWLPRRLRREQQRPRGAALTYAVAWLVAVGIVATCFAVIRLIPRQPTPMLEATQPSE